MPVLIDSHAVPSLHAELQPGLVNGRGCDCPISIAANYQVLEVIWSAQQASLDIRCLCMKVTSQLSCLMRQGNAMLTCQTYLSNCHWALHQVMQRCAFLHLMIA